MQNTHLGSLTTCETPAAFGGRPGLHKMNSRKNSPILEFYNSKTKSTHESEVLRGLLGLLRGRVVDDRLQQSPFRARCPRLLLFHSQPQWFPTRSRPHRCRKSGKRRPPCSSYPVRRKGNSCYNLTRILRTCSNLHHDFSTNNSVLSGITGFCPTHPHRAPCASCPSD